MANHPYPKYTTKISKPKPRLWRCLRLRADRIENISQVDRASNVKKLVAKIDRL